MNEKQTARKHLLDIAIKYLGTQENTSEGKVLVEMFLNSVGLKGNLPWCAAFISFCLEEAEKTYGKSGIVQTAGVLNMWEKTPKELRIEKPEAGAIAIYQSQKNDKLLSTGHAGIVFDYPKPNLFITIEGNTTDGKGIDRDGDGVYKKMRPYPSFYKTLVLKGFLLPWA
jgi:hypothetical protein